MEDLKKKRWSATYTKHIKQKRKVYQDGFLDLHIPTNKVMLLDDCEKLLECRILKNEEIVSSGETLAFSGYLVDVDDLEGDTKSVFDLHLRGRDRKMPEKPSLMHRQKFRSPSVSCGDRKDDPEKVKEWKNKLSPSQKIIRDFKKSEQKRYGAPKSSPDIPNPRISEWQIMYTTQVTQKAKKYHDGFLRLATCGSTGRQVILYDESRKLLTSRFLKRDDIIRSGESISLEGYLVEIGEPEEDHKPLLDLNIQPNHCNIVGKTKTMHGQQNCFHGNVSVGKEFSARESQAPQSTAATIKPNITEWQVMYTTQVTQKAKKYHDGFLRLAACGSLGRQVLVRSGSLINCLLDYLFFNLFENLLFTEVKLFDTNANLLDSRFLKKDEVIGSGESIAFDGHLVDIGEPEAENQLLVDLNVQGNDSNVAGKAGTLHGPQKYHKANKSVAKTKFRNSFCSRKDADSSSLSSLEKIKSSMIIPTNKPIRDASQILSNLQKPIARHTVMGSTDKSITVPVSSIKGLQVLDADMTHSKDCQLPEASLSNHGSREIVDVEWSSKIMDLEQSSDLNPSKAASAFCGNQLPNDTEAGNPDQSHLDNVKADTKWGDETFAFGISSYASVCAPEGPSDDEKKSNVQLKSAREMDELPTFDLGF